MEMTLTRIEKEQLQQTFRILFQNNLTDQPVVVQSLLDEGYLYDYLKQTGEILANRPVIGCRITTNKTFNKHTIRSCSIYRSCFQ